MQLNEAKKLLCISEKRLDAIKKIITTIRGAGSSRGDLLLVTGLSRGTLGDILTILLQCKIIAKSRAPSMERWEAGPFKGRFKRSEDFYTLVGNVTEITFTIFF